MELIIKRRIAVILPLTFIFFYISPISSSEINDNKYLILDHTFFRQLYSTPSIARDDFLESNLNRLVKSRGVVQSMGKFERYRRKYRVIVTASEAGKYNMQILFYIFVESKKSIAVLEKNEEIEFSGQLIGFTPTSSRRDKYILDVIFEKGAIIVD